MGARATATLNRRLQADFPARMGARTTTVRPYPPPAPSIPPPPVIPSPPAILPPPSVKPSPLVIPAKAGIQTPVHLTTRNRRLPVNLDTKKGAPQTMRYPTCASPATLSSSRIQHRNTCRLKVPDVPGNHREPMLYRGGSNKQVWAVVSNARRQLPPAPRRSYIHRQNPVPV